MKTMVPWQTYTEWPIISVVLMANLHHRLWAYSLLRADFESETEKRYCETLLAKWRETAIAGSALALRPDSETVARDFFTKMEDARQSEEMAIQIAKGEMKRKPGVIPKDQAEDILASFEFMGVGDPWWTAAYRNWKDKISQIKSAVEGLEKRE